ncbi:hypothetical protein PAXRUDRAFT_777250 [Paxillus rubicundulus Ve08.2h10]|uniref:Uncharacterized protein n=1 Tax=Paxillus rubicundulus Ve08.2h10 TaxID=930991 RepID=A0A0D0E9A0_9AGAM|nr:hypothetical protein PAXRUDRAFT_777250 [Paxillus rubicundulus Ve08.2h10]
MLLPGKRGPVKQIASPTGVMTPAEYSRQLGGSPLAWGVGALSSPHLPRSRRVDSFPTRHTHVGELKTRFERFISHKLLQDVGTAATVEQKRELGAAGSQQYSCPLEYWRNRRLPATNLFSPNTKLRERRRPLVPQPKIYTSSVNSALCGFWYNQHRALQAR